MASQAATSASSAPHGLTFRLVPDAASPAAVATSRASRRSQARRGGSGIKGVQMSNASQISNGAKLTKGSPGAASAAAPSTAAENTAAVGKAADLSLTASDLSLFASLLTPSTTEIFHQAPTTEPISFLLSLAEAEYQRLLTPASESRSPASTVNGCQWSNVQPSAHQCHSSQPSGSKLSGSLSGRYASSGSSASQRGIATRNLTQGHPAAPQCTAELARGSAPGSAALASTASVAQFATGRAAGLASTGHAATLSGDEERLLTEELFTLDALGGTAMKN